jgi:Zn-dependent protease with chaperone function
MTLGFFARAIVQVLAAHAIVSTVASLIVLASWRHVAPDFIGSASTTSRRLFWLRMAPTAAAAFLAWGAIPVAFALWEPAGKIERVGPVALMLAVAGAGLIASSLWRLALALWETNRIHRSLVDATRAPLPLSPLPAFVIDSSFPIVALVGVFVSRLFVARNVVDACDEGELRAVIAHEQAHAAARDNLKRLLMGSAVDVLAWLPLGKRMLRDWAATAELAADENAVRHNAGRLPLASALIKVARLAIAPPGGALPASTLYRGEPIAARVHRLLDGPAPAIPPLRSWSWRVPGALMLATAPLWLRGLYWTIEELLNAGL